MSDALDLSRLSRLIDSVTGPTGGWLVSPAEFADRLDRCVRDLLSVETQQIREERDALRKQLQDVQSDYGWLQARAEQAEAEALALREALEKLTAQFADGAPPDPAAFETALSHARRLTPASHRTGEETK